ncbi:MAG: type II toxin-antitoxin system mRNA interferase toxin, RelE/StbE family [Chloroflexi bacterium]|nr:type II toxin-antitoxin system mRNA interferase toxin, RelE/StbE family [Chloroflexota bacterium]
MIEVRWSPQAFQDLHGIRTYIAQNSPVYADLTVQRIVAAVERLRRFPDSGRMVPERQSPELREIIVRNYRVVYRRRPDSVEIVAVFRGSREFAESQQ